ncbi:MAG: metal-dependent hydrolase [bacterium]|nr:metal-dependent hydrolase [bacterium]
MTETTIKYLGHSAFYIKTGNCGILIDPWFMHNPNVKFDIENETVTHILITHGHGDHFGDTIPIAKAKDATVIAIFETGLFCEKLGLKAIGVGMSGAIKTEFGSVRFLPAYHTNTLPNGQYGGIAASILLELNDGKKIYHAGDTGLTKEFELIGDIYSPEITMLPIGGHFTMDAKDAVIAAEMLRAETVIPMHYNTFDTIKADVEKFQMDILSKGIRCAAMQINEEILA